MSDNQSWNSSGSEEDIEPREDPGHHVGVADLSGVLSKVSCFPPNSPMKRARRGDVNRTRRPIARPEFSGFPPARASDGATLPAARSAYRTETEK